MKLIIRFLAAFCLLSLSLSGQDTYLKKADTAKPFVLGNIHQIISAELGETRTLNIYLPEGYSPDSATGYPVIYLLDGSANEDFIHISGIVQYLTMIETMRPSIVVGIANIDRKKDFTFPTTITRDKKDFPTTGGSARFIAFIEKELQPFIQKNYKVNQTKAIIGQSLGGLLATEILLKKPALFNQYFIISPSLWWDKESLLKRISTLPQQLVTATAISVFIAVGKEGSQMENDAKQLATGLTALNDKKVTIWFSPMNNENHLTILHNSIYLGLKQINSSSGPK